jgi:YYY domain-containing protein
VTTFLFASLSGVLVSFAVLLLMVLAVLALLAHARGNRADVFALGLALAGLLAFLGPEWLHLRDGFSGNLARMNTVFKFHYQAWLLLALASAYAVYYVLAGRGEAGTPSSISAPRLVWGVAVAAVVAGCLVYPAMAFYTKANQFQGTPTLDGAAHLQRFAPDEYSAIQWLNRNVKGAPVIVEVVGGSFSEYARISAHTGLPTVQGWGGHESQWRSTKGWEAREGDVNRIYATMDINEAKSLLRKYGVTYVYVGRLERETRGNDNQPKYSAAALGKFGQFMDVAFQQGSVTIYKWRE